MGTGLDSHACASTERSWPRVAVSLDCLATVHPPVVLQTPDVVRRSSCLARGARDLSTGMKRLQHQVSSGHLDPPARATARVPKGEPTAAADSFRFFQSGNSLLADQNKLHVGTCGLALQWEDQGD